MGASYYITLVFYTEIPREALPAHLDDPEKPVFQILIENGLHVYPGSFYDYDDEDRDEPVYYSDDDVDEKNPKVNLLLVGDVWDNANIPDWAYTDTFNKDAAMFTEMHVMESYKSGNAGDAGDNTGMSTRLLKLGIDTSKTTTGWQVVGRME